MLHRIVLHTPSSVPPHSPNPFLSSSSWSLSDKIYQRYVLPSPLDWLLWAFRTLPCHNTSPPCLLCRPFLHRPHAWFLVPPLIILFRSQHQLYAALTVRQGARRFSTECTLAAYHLESQALVDTYPLVGRSVLCQQTTCFLISGSFSSPLGFFGPGSLVFALLGGVFLGGVASLFVRALVVST